MKRALSLLALCSVTLAVSCDRPSQPSRLDATPNGSVLTAPDSSPLAELQTGKGRGRGHQPPDPPPPPQPPPPDPPPVPAPDPLPAGWWIYYSEGVTLEQTAQGQPTFLFPLAPGFVSYFTKAWAGATGGTMTATIAQTVESGTPVGQVYQPDCVNGNGPAATFYLQGTNPPNMTADDAQYLRWWTRAEYAVIYPGVQTIRATFDPRQWSSVGGRFGDYSPRATELFWWTANNGGRIGFTFGGGCSFGHGVYVSGGRLRFTVTRFDVS